MAQDLERIPTRNRLSVYAKEGEKEGGKGERRKDWGVAQLLLGQSSCSPWSPTRVKVTDDQGPRLPPP